MLVMVSVQSFWAVIVMISLFFSLTAKVIIDVKL
jgi:hypothetical protein